MPSLPARSITWFLPGFEQRDLALDLSQLGCSLRHRQRVVVVRHRLKLAIQGSDHPLRVEPREGFQGFRVPRRTVLLGSVPPMNDESAELGVDDGLALPGETSH